MTRYDYLDLSYLLASTHLNRRHEGESGGVFIFNQVQQKKVNVFPCWLRGTDTPRTIIVVVDVDTQTR